MDGEKTGSRSIKINNWLWIDETDIEITFIRASGPGGQNVNRVETAVQLRFKALQSNKLPPWVYDRLVTLAGQRMTTSGEVVITARRHRTQEANRNDAFARLKALLAAAAQRDPKRIPTKPTLGSKRRRLESKKKQSQRKAERRSSDAD